MNFAEMDAAATDAADREGLSGEVGNISQTCPKLKLEVGVFFDGTLNNRFNVLSRARDDDSYKNALSNPALLYARYKNHRRHNELNACGGVGRAFRSIYVEGPGSARNAADDAAGYALGQGRTGVEARVLDAFQRLLRLIGTMGGPSMLDKVVLDVFGFSRGAAAARYFVNCIRARQVAYDPWGPGDYNEVLPRGLKVEIRFLGIFDTVAAIGVNAASDDNGAVNVHVKTAQVTGQIYHLTAGDEYRRNFRLNRNVPGGGSTRELPGAHSDVGGGYRDPGDRAPLGPIQRRSFDTRAAAEAAQAETRRADLAAGVNSADETVFVNEGWMRANETTGGIVRHMGPIVEMPITVRSGFSTTTRMRYAYDEQRSLDRPWVQVGLSRIALHMMYEAAVAHVDGAFLALPVADPNYVIPEGLLPYEAQIRSGQLRGAARRFVLRNYGHVSMKDGALLSGDRVGHQPESDRQRVEYDNDTAKAI